MSLALFRRNRDCVPDRDRIHIKLVHQGIAGYEIDCCTAETLNPLLSKQLRSPNMPRPSWPPSGFDRASPGPFHEMFASVATFAPLENKRLSKLIGCVRSLGCFRSIPRDPLCQGEAGPAQCLEMPL